VEFEGHYGGNVSQIILDISANTFKNDEAYYKRMVNELSAVDTRKHEVILKWQLFEESETNIAADTLLFYKMIRWAWVMYGYKTTASVFDKQSLNELMFSECVAVDNYKLPFIKIANNRKYDWLIGEIPRKYKVYKSVDNYWDWQKDDWDGNTIYLWCVSEYPAPMEDYPEVEYLSDHTVGLELFHRNEPVIWEKHYKLPDSTGLDAGDFAITPEGLKEIL
jgi:sialic acid synthase SpsE